MQQTRLSKAKATLLGALVGDAIGTRLEFMSRLPSEEEVSIALSMPGGGPFDLASGQITDDGEMTICLARGLLEVPDAIGYPTEAVARRYHDWFRSAPFDIGMTTKTALRGGIHDAPELAMDFQISAQRYNMGSKANGALMRATPLGLWSVRRSQEIAVQAAKQDTRLTHPNLSCQWATAAYVLAIRHLLLHPDDAPFDAFMAARQCVEQAGTDAAEVLGWLDQAADGQLPDGFPQAGFVKIALTYAFFHLLRTSSFTEAIRATLSRGGDTDTNACIVGGLMGATLGFENLPAEMVNKVLTVNTTDGQERPQWLIPHDAIDMATQLIGSPAEQNQS